MTAEKSKWSPEPPGGDLSPLILREKPEKPSEYASTDTPREVFTPSPSPGIPSVQLDGTSSKGRSRARAQQPLNPILPAFSLAGTALSKHSATPRVTSQPPPSPSSPICKPAAIPWAQQELQGAPGCWKNCWFAQEWPQGCWNNPACSSSCVPASPALPPAAKSHTQGCDTNCATSAALRAGGRQELQEGLGGALQLLQDFPSSPRSWDHTGQRAGNGDFSHHGTGREFTPRSGRG